MGATAGLALISTVAGGLSLVGRRAIGHGSPKGQLADAWAAGVFLGLGFLHMLPEAVHAFVVAGGNGRLIFLVAGLTLLLLLILGRVGGTGNARFHAIIVTAVLVLHMFLTGFALAAENAPGVIVMVFVALAIHKAVEAFAFGRLLARSPLDSWLAGLLLMVFVSALPAGVFTALTVARSMASAPAAIPMILAIGAGTFLHFGLNHSHLLGSDNGWQALGARIAGFLLMGGLALFASS